MVKSLLVIKYGFGANKIKSSKNNNSPLSIDDYVNSLKFENSQDDADNGKTTKNLNIIDYKSEVDTEIPTVPLNIPNDKKAIDPIIPTENLNISPVIISEQQPTKKLNIPEIREKLFASVDTLNVSTQNLISSRTPITFPATPPTNPISLVKTAWGTYSQSGSRIYNSGFNFNGTGTISNTLTTPVIWKNTTNNLTDGPMNRSVIWASTTNPINTWLGFSTCLNIASGQSKTYYVGVGADNHFRLVLDGTVILDTYSQGNTGETYIWWNIYPIFIPEGDHVLEIYGLNINGPAGFGAQIYDNTAQQLVAATQISDINMIWTSNSYTTATIVQDLAGNYLSSGYSCTGDAVYSECTGLCTLL